MTLLLCINKGTKTTMGMVLEWKSGYRGLGWGGTIVCECKAVICDLTVCVCVASASNVLVCSFLFDGVRLTELFVSVLKKI